MSTWGRLIAFFPSMLGVLGAACLVWWGMSGSPLAFVALLVVLYVVPVAGFRLHQWFVPTRLGACRLIGSRYVAWWGAHQFQIIYLAVPQLEAALRLVPGLYSAWLRCWGARVGKRVYWTPLVEISDRNLLHIGDDVVIGHRAGIYGHIIRPTRDNLMLYCKPVVVGTGAFIGAAAVLGPGSHVASKAFVEAGAKVHPNEKVEQKKKTDSVRST